MIRRSNFKSRLKVHLKLKFEDIKNYLKKIYEKHCKFIIIFGFIIYLFATIFSIVSNSIILAVVLSVFLPITISVMIEMLGGDYSTDGASE